MASCAGDSSTPRSGVFKYCSNATDVLSVSSLSPVPVLVRKSLGRLRKVGGRDSLLHLPPPEESAHLLAS